ncbi:MAG: hypothetical protein AB7V18_06130 [Pyrinomonadaceae bacterium]
MKHAAQHLAANSHAVYGVVRFAQARASARAIHPTHLPISPLLTRSTDTSVYGHPPESPTGALTYVRATDTQATTRPDRDWTARVPSCKRRLPDGPQNGQFTVARVCYTRNGMLSAVRTIGETRFFENHNSGRAAIRQENQARSGKPRAVGEGWNPKLFFE